MNFIKIKINYGKVAVCIGGGGGGGELVMTYINARNFRQVGTSPVQITMPANFSYFFLQV